MISPIIILLLIILFFTSFIHGFSSDSNSTNQQASGIKLFESTIEYLSDSFNSTEDYDSNQFTDNLLNSTFKGSNYNGINFYKYFNNYDKYNDTKNTENTLESRINMDIDTGDYPRDSSKTFDNIKSKVMNKLLGADKLNRRQFIVVPKQGLKINDLTKNNLLIAGQLMNNQMNSKSSNTQSNQQYSSKLGSQLNNQLNSQLTNQLTNQLNNHLQNQLNNHLSNQLSSQVKDSLSKDKPIIAMYTPIEQAKTSIKQWTENLLRNSKIQQNSKTSSLNNNNNHNSNHNHHNNHNSIKSSSLSPLSSSSLHSTSSSTSQTSSASDYNNNIKKSKPITIQIDPSNSYFRADQLSSRNLLDERLLGLNNLHGLSTDLGLLGDLKLSNLPSGGLQLSSLLSNSNILKSDPFIRYKNKAQGSSPNYNNLHIIAKTLAALNPLKSNQINTIQPFLMSDQSLNYLKPLLKSSFLSSTSHNDDRSNPISIFSDTHTSIGNNPITDLGLHQLTSSANVPILDNDQLGLDEAIRKMELISQLNKKNMLLGQNAISFDEVLRDPLYLSNFKSDLYVDDRTLLHNPFDKVFDDYYSFPNLLSRSKEIPLLSIPELVFRTKKRSKNIKIKKEDESEYISPDEETDDNYEEASETTDNDEEESRGFVITNANKSNDNKNINNSRNQDSKKKNNTSNDTNKNENKNKDKNVIKEIRKDDGRCKNDSIDDTI